MFLSVIIFHPKVSTKAEEEEGRAVEEVEEDEEAEEAEEAEVQEEVEEQAEVPCQVPT